METKAFTTMRIFSMWTRVLGKKRLVIIRSIHIDGKEVASHLLALASPKILEYLAPFHSIHCPIILTKFLY